jgi:hypothetical protein
MKTNIHSSTKTIVLIDSLTQVVEVKSLQLFQHFDKQYSLEIELNMLFLPQMHVKIR